MFDRSKFTRLAWTLAVVSGLLFGGYQALEGTALHTCNYAPPDELGSCINTNECDQKCSLWWDEYFAVCDNYQGGHGCCTCIAG